MELAIRNTQTLSNMDEIERAALAMSKSGYFTDARDQAQAITKILAGREMGFGPFASMTGIYIISGRPAIGANIMAAAVKASGRYNYRVIEMTETACEIAFYEGKSECGRSRFTLEDARKAGTKNLDKFARNMLFARAMSNGCRWYCPDVFLGAPTYTPEELGATVDEDGSVIDVPVVVKPTPARQPEPEPAGEKSWNSAKVSIDQARAEAASNGQLYWEMTNPELANRLNGIAKGMSKPETTDAHREELAWKRDVIQAILAYRQV